MAGRAGQTIAPFRQAWLGVYAINACTPKYLSSLNNGAELPQRREGDVWIGEFGAKCQTLTLSHYRSLILPDSFLWQYGVEARLVHPRIAQQVEATTAKAFNEEEGGTRAGDRSALRSTRRSPS